MKKFYLFTILAICMSFGSYSYAQSGSGGRNCINISNSGLDRSSSVIRVSASDTSNRAKNLEALHRKGYFYKEITEETQQLGFGDTRQISVITYTITDSGKRKRRVTVHDLVSETWKFCN